jgi:hypothetical protein
MGATSVTGVGPGSALGLNKGNDNMSLGVSKLLGPHLVAAGSLTVGPTHNFAVPLSSGVYACSVNVMASGSTVPANANLVFTSGNCSMWVSPNASGLAVSYMVSTVGNA